MHFSIILLEFKCVLGTNVHHSFYSEVNKGVKTQFMNKRVIGKKVTHTSLELLSKNTCIDLHTYIHPFNTRMNQLYSTGLRR